MCACACVYMCVIAVQNNSVRKILYITVFVGCKRNWSMAGLNGSSGNYEHSCKSDTSIKAEVDSTHL